MNESKIEKIRKEKEALALKYSKQLPDAQSEVDPLEFFIVSAGLILYEFFHTNGFHIRRDEWSSYNNLDLEIREYSGWVYGFYAEDDTPLYIGETGNTLKVRFDDHSSNEKMIWWDYWTAVKVLPCFDVTSRKLFESLLGLCGGYTENKMQPKSIDDPLFSSMLGLIDLKSRLTSTSPQRRYQNPDKLIEMPHKDIIEKLSHIASLYKYGITKD